MKLKTGFMLREIAGEWLVVPIGDRTVEFNKLINLSESGAVLWRVLENDAEPSDLLNALKAEYDVDDETAMGDVMDFIAMLDVQGLLEE